MLLGNYYNIAKIRIVNSDNSSHQIMSGSAMFEYGSHPVKIISIH